MQKALILSADGWEMTDEKSGKTLNGVSVWFVNDYRDDAPGSLGFKPTKIGATPEIFSELSKPGVALPAVVEMDLGSRPGAQGKAALTLVGIKHVKNVELFQASK